MKKILSRFSSPVVVATVLLSAAAFIEVTDFGSAKAVAAGALGFLAAVFGAVNNPTDRDGF